MLLFDIHIYVWKKALDIWIISPVVPDCWTEQECEQNDTFLSIMWQKVNVGHICWLAFK